MPPRGVCPSDQNALPDRCNNSREDVDSVDRLITVLRNYNQNGSKSSRARAGSAFIFWTLLGKDAKYANAHGGRSIPNNYTIPNVSGTGWTALENLINDELANRQISIDWHADFNAAHGLFPRTYAMWVPNEKAADVAYDTGDGSQTGAAISFTDNSTHRRIYALFRECANPGGELNGLPAYNPSWTLTGTTRVLGGSAQVTGGSQITFRSSITNQGPNDSTSFAYAPYYFYSNTPNPTRRANRPYPGEQGGAIRHATLGSGGTIWDIDQTVTVNRYGKKYICGTVGFSPWNSRGNVDGRSVARCVLINYPAPPASCGGTVEKPGTIDPDTPFTVTAAFSTNATAAQTAGDEISIAVHGPSPSDTFTYGPTSIKAPPPANGSLSVTTGSIGPTMTPGSFSISYSLANAARQTTVSCTSTFAIAYMPYFNVVGGDVETGAGMMVNGACTVSADPKAGVVSWNRDGGSSGTDFSGAGTQYAALALNHLQDFVTAQDGDASGLGPPPDPSNQLAFANTLSVNGMTNVDPIGGLFGGDFDSEACMQDYYSRHPSGPTQSPGTLSSVAPGTHNIYVKGDEVVKLSSAPVNVPNDSHTTLYVGGNVTIESNVTFSGSYHELADIPSLTIVAKGNIYIRPRVSELDGLYVAEPDVNPVTGAATAGVVYTCTTVPFYPTPFDANLQVNAQQYYQTCDTHLDVYGSVMARQVWLLRTYGTLYQQVSRSCHMRKSRTPGRLILSA